MISKDGARSESNQRPWWVENDNYELNALLQSSGYLLMLSPMDRSLLVSAIVSQTAMCVRVTQHAQRAYLICMRKESLWLTTIYTEKKVSLHRI